MGQEFIARNGLKSLGGLTLPYTGISQNYTVQDSDYLIEVKNNTQDLNITLPDSTDLSGKVLIIKNSSEFIVNVNTYSNQLIDSNGSKKIYANKHIQLISTGNGWIVVGVQTTMFQETVTADTGNDLTQVTNNGGVLPSNSEQVMLYGGGANSILAPIHPDNYTVNSSQGTITLNWTPEANENFLIIWYEIG